MNALDGYRFLKSISGETKYYTVYECGNLVLEETNGGISGLLIRQASKGSDVVLASLEHLIPTN